MNKICLDWGEVYKEMAGVNKLSLVFYLNER